MVVVGHVGCTKGTGVVVVGQVGRTKGRVWGRRGTWPCSEPFTTVHLVPNLT